MDKQQDTSSNMPVPLLDVTEPCEYNEERPKKGLGGLTPALYAKQLAAESSTVTPGL